MLMESPMYKDSKNTLGVSYCAQVDSVEGLEGLLLSRWWLAAGCSLNHPLSNVRRTSDLGVGLVASVRTHRDASESWCNLPCLEMPCLEVPCSYMYQVGRSMIRKVGCQAEPYFVGSVVRELWNSLLFCLSIAEMFLLDSSCSCLDSMFMLGLAWDWLSLIVTSKPVGLARSVGKPMSIKSVGCLAMSPPSWFVLACGLSS